MPEPALVQTDSSGSAIIPGRPYIAQETEHGITFTLLTPAELQYLNDPEIQHYVKEGRRTLQSGRVRRLDRSKH